MIIPGRAATDQILAKTEREIERLYRGAYKEIKAKAEKALAKLTDVDNYMKMSPAEITAEMKRFERLNHLEKQVTELLTDTNAEAVRIINRRMADVYGVNFGEAAKIFPPGSVLPVLSRSAVSTVLAEQVAPFKQLAIDSLLDADVIRRELTRSLLTGIIQGESIPSLAERIRDQVDKSLNESIRIARTETTRVENSAKQDVGIYGKELGFKMKKEWISTRDSRTRPEHNEANGQVVDIDKPFIVGGEELMYPGDDAGSAWNVINCRCTTVNIIV